MLREQYEEIDRLKKSSESATQHNARFALRTIKEFTNKGALTFSYSLDKQAVRDVDDFVIQKFLRPCVFNGKTGLLVSNDIPFLTKAYDLRNSADRRGSGMLEVMDGKEFDLMFAHCELSPP